MEKVKPLHASKLMHGSVFALKVNGVAKVIWYYFQYRDKEGYIYYTAMHNHEDYKSATKNPDRNVWIRDFSK